MLLSLINYYSQNKRGLSSLSSCSSDSKISSQRMTSSVDGIELTDELSKSDQDGIELTDELSKSDQHILNFLDSTDSYLTLMDSLSSALHQGWFDLASARLSMGASRVNSALFDLKSHHASTTLQLQDDGLDIEPPRFTLCKWASSDDAEKYSGKAKFDEDELLQSKSKNPLEEPQENKAERGGSPVTFVNQAEKERFKSLSMFGTLVSPKLRVTQLSFETALEVLVELSNTRASLLHAYDQVQKDLKSTE